MTNGPGTTAKVVGGVVAVGLALLVLKWLAITAALLAVPFGAWWLWDRSRTPAVAGPAATRMPAPPLPPSRPLPARTTMTRAATVEPVTAPVRAAVELLPGQRKVTVTREEDHQHVLTRHHRPGSVPSARSAQLCSSTVTRGTHRGVYAIEVRLDGERVGELTAAMSERYRGVVTGAERRGHAARCEAMVSHGERGFQVDLRLPAVT